MSHELEGGTWQCPLRTHGPHNQRPQGKKDQSFDSKTWKPHLIYQRFASKDKGLERRPSQRHSTQRCDSLRQRNQRSPLCFPDAGTYSVSYNMYLMISLNISWFTKTPYASEQQCWNAGAHDTANVNKQWGILYYIITCTTMVYMYIALAPFWHPPKPCCGTQHCLSVPSNNTTELLVQAQIVDPR